MLRTLLLFTLISHPILEDRSVYRDYVNIQPREVGIERIVDGWVQGRVWMSDRSPSIGLVDAVGLTYVGPVDGTTPDGPAFSCRWLVTAGISQNLGVFISSPYGNWIQNTPYDENSAILRIETKGNILSVYLNGRRIHSIMANDLSSHDLRAYYFGFVDDELISRYPRINLFKGRR